MMAQDPARRRSVSPASSSGRASPIPRQPRRQFEDEPRRHDKTYRRYATAIERVLATFDTTNEWPDYISFLGRLLKAIQTQPTANLDIPHRSIVANRLAQCLNPTLPSGVHQKALEVYAYIFSVIGKDTLAADLTLYLPGLAPVLTFASLSLRPLFLALVETYILELNTAALRPALRSLLLCLLPGLEEENSEDFDRTLRIVDGLRDVVGSKSGKGESPLQGDGYFWQCLFFAGVSSASRRQGLLTFLSKRLPVLAGSTPCGDRNKDDEEVTVSAVISPEPGLLIRCFVAGLQDEQLLVQRGYLDLLLTHIPLHSPILAEKVENADMERLVGAATSVVARRDMSLNRRLWSWLLGPQANEDPDGENAGITTSLVEDSPAASVVVSKPVEYFGKYGSRHLIHHLLASFAKTSRSAVEMARPFRICLSLMDRQEIGNAIIPHIFVPAIQSIRSYHNTASPDNFRDVLRSANSFFDAIESGMIWQQMLGLVSATSSAEDEHVQGDSNALEVVLFVLDHFNIHEEDMTKTHIPLVLLYALASVNETEREGSNINTLSTIMIAERLTDILRGRALGEPDEGGEPPPSLTSANLCEVISSMFVSNGSFSEKSQPMMSTITIEYLVLSQSQAMLFAGLQKLNADANIASRSKILSTLLANAQIDLTSQAQEAVAEFRQLIQRLDTIHSANPQLSFHVLLATTQSLAQFAAIGALATTECVGLIADVLRGLWAYLTPSFPKYQLEAVRCMWQLDDLASDERLVEASLAAALSGVSATSRTISSTECARRFAVLWTHTTNINASSQRRANSVFSRQTASAADARPYSISADFKEYGSRLYRPLLLLLDSCKDVESEMGYFVRNWLESLPSVRIIFQVLLEGLVSSASALPSPSTTSQEAKQQVLHKDCRAELLYYLEAIISVLRISSEYMWATLIENSTSNPSGVREEHQTLMEALLQESLQVVQNSSTIPHTDREEVDTTLQRTALSLLQLLIRSPEPAIVQQYHLEDALIQVLMHTVQEEGDNSAIQVALLDTVTAALELQVRFVGTPARLRTFRRTSSMDAVKSLTRMSLHSTDKNANAADSQTNPALPAQLVKSVQAAVASSSSHHVLDNWITFLTGVLPLYSDAIFQNMIPLVDSFCSRIKTILSQLDQEFKGKSTNSTIAPEPALLSLLNGLEYVVTTGHERMISDDLKKASTKTPEPSQGFFGNVVSGVFATETQKARNTVGNARLTIILCYQDTLKVCLALWAWGEANRQSSEIDGACVASFGYMSQRLRNRARRILDRMFQDEPLECTETLIVNWQEQMQMIGSSAISATSLLHVLDSARPKRIIPALFNAIYSRTIPTGIDASRTSSLTSDLSDIDLGHFLLEYTQSCDADALDEIWNDCMAFLRDVLTNPLPQHNILPSLLLFLVILGEKIENTNFGEQRKMRKDLADLFIRLLTAMFTTRSSGSLMETAIKDRPSTSDSKARIARRGAADHTIVLNEVITRLSSVITDSDRIVSVVTNISTNVLAPILHARIFPDNLRSSYLQLWLNLTKVSQASKIWKKDIMEALNHAKLFSTRYDLVQSGWLPIFGQLMLNDKERLTEIITRITPPASAGNIFGVGASAARLEADKKTQLNLRRITLLLMSGEKDSAISSYSILEEKIAELITASAASSPSSATRAEVFMLVRALVLRTSYIHLVSLWPIITAELQRAISSSFPRSIDYDLYNTFSVIQACKLLDLLLVVAPDDFQLHEWLFITDTIEAVYRPADRDPVALVDNIADELGSSEPQSAYPPTPGTDLTRTMSFSMRSTGMKAPLLGSVGKEMAEASKAEVVQAVLRPWFAGLSMQAFEATYGMLEVDWAACEEAVLRDLFDHGTLVG